MFTGLIEEVGRVEEIHQTPQGLALRIACRFGDLIAGESVAVNGACLTVVEVGPGWFTVAAVGTTLERTTIGDWKPGRGVNLERALVVGDRLGGHIVQGHVDGVATVVETRQAGDARLVDLALPAGLPELMVRHGSIAVDGVSLTINDIPRPDQVQLSLIEFTLRHTALADLGEGERVHVEADVVGKYVRNLIAPYGNPATRFA